MQYRGIDIHKPAVINAKLTMKWLGVEHKVDIIESDLFEKLAGEKFDVIFFFPPGAQSEFSFSSTRKMVAEFEDIKYEALLHKLFSQLELYLNKSGMLYLVVLKNDTFMYQMFEKYHMQADIVASHSSLGWDNFDIYAVRPFARDKEGERGTRSPYYPALDFKKKPEKNHTEIFI